MDDAMQRDNLQSSKDEISMMSDEYRDDSGEDYVTNEDAERMEKSDSGLRHRTQISKMMDSQDTHQKHMLHTPLPVERRKTRLFTGCCGVILIMLISAVVWIYLYVQNDPIKTPLNTPMVKSPDFSLEHFWGTYRPNVYFGLRTRSESSLVVGLMWYSLENNKLRHWCRENDGLVKYGWLRHDGINFGIHEVVEKTYRFNVSFVKRQGGSYGGDWTTRISATPTSAKTTSVVSFFFYIALEGHGVVKPYLKNTKLFQVTGETPELGSFRLRFPSAHSPSSWYLTNLVTKEANINNLTKVVINELKEKLLWDNISAFLLQNRKEKKGNFIVYQITAKLPLEFDVVFESESFLRPTSLEGEVMTKELSSHLEQFDKKFYEVFGLKSAKYTKFAKTTLSNMLGSISYFYGTSQVKSKTSKDIQHYWPTTLYTTVPSRSKFPRGFLWNVGFDIHLINIWDASISMDIIAHWLDLMNIEGWIPREQILGPEAESAVPRRFIVQTNDIANPPALFLGILNLIEMKKASVTFLKDIFPRLEIWFNWLYTSQAGEMPNSFYWRGRDSLTESQLIPYTFASGLDDYPRSSHPNSTERHLDLRCWIAVSSRALAKIAKLTDQDGTKYEKIYYELSDNEFLDKMHWDNDNKLYSDFGLHTNFLNMNATSKSRVVHADPSLRYVAALGYVSLFPLMLRILDSDSPRLHKILQDLRNEDLLWTKYGIRSLAKNSPFYNRYNTVDDPPHWRGAIWINMNYLIVSSLHHYSKIPGLYQNLAFEIYTELRKKLKDNVMKEYKNKGYVFEKYNDVTGVGEGSYPFTGWSALIVNIITEKY